MSLEKKNNTGIKNLEETNSMESSQENHDALENTPKTETVASTTNKQETTTATDTENNLAPSKIAESTPTEVKTKEEKDSAIEEINDSNAEDAEDEDIVKRHDIPMPNYEEMSMEELVQSLQKLVQNEKIQAIRKHVDAIKNAFDDKFQDFIETKKAAFIENGGNEIDFRYTSVTKGLFNEVFSDYKEKRNAHYKSLEKSHRENLSYRLELIENLKALVSVEENINTTYNTFKDIQAKWRNAGPIPKSEYNNVWKTYHHHIEIFYDFLNINRELRDLDFKHNLEEKTKIVLRAEELAVEPDLNRAFRELQVLHKIWKEDLGPVGKEHREEIWNRFSAATKTIHNRRQDYFKNLDKIKEENLANKNGIIEQIKTITESISEDHSTLQKQLKKVEELRQSFFKAGPVPQAQNSKTWANFKAVVKNFNKAKNSFYKNIKKEQQLNLAKKRALLEIASSLKDSEEWDSATQEFKRIQGEWKKIGHVPRKYSDKLWEEFRGACNHYFDRVKSLKNESHKEEEENYSKKEAFLEQLKAFKLSGNKEADLKTLKDFSKEWNSIGRVPFKKKSIHQEFDKIVDVHFKNLGIGKQESELLNYGDRIAQLATEDHKERAIEQERAFIRSKMDEIKTSINQLENNLQFFSNASESNPMVQEVMQKVEKQKMALTGWKKKLKTVNILKNTIKKEEALAQEEEASNPEDLDTDA